MNVLLCIAAMIAVPSWFMVIYFEIKVLRHLKPGIRLWADAPFWNPFNHSFTSNLTEAGVRARRHALFAWMGFVIPIVLTLLVAALTGNLDQ